MLVASQLKSAQLEMSSDTDATCTMKAKIQYDEVNGNVVIGNGLEAKNLVPTEAKTYRELISLMYPIGSMQYNMLNSTDFLNLMGSSWVDTAGLYRLASDTGYILIPAYTTLGETATDLGKLIVDNDATKSVDYDDGTGIAQYAKMVSPSGRYLRAAGSDQDENVLEHNTKLSNQNKRHNHSSNAGPRSEFTRDGASQGSGPDGMVYNYINATIGQEGGDEARPETAIYNLYLKVNTI